MSYDGGCGDVDCVLCQKDSRIAALEHTSKVFADALRNPSHFSTTSKVVQDALAEYDILSAHTCPRFLPPCPDSPDGNHHVAPIGSDEEWMPSKAPCYYCGEKQAS